MTRLEDVKIGAVLAGVAPSGLAEVLSVEWIGSTALNVVFRPHAGPVSETTLYRDDEHRLSIESSGQLWSLDANAALLRLVTEANRIKLAHCLSPLKLSHYSATKWRSMRWLGSDIRMRIA